MSAKEAAAAASGEAQAVEQVAEQGLLDQIVAQGRFTSDAATLERGRDMVKEFVSQVLEGRAMRRRRSRRALRRSTG